MYSRNFESEVGNDIGLYWSILLLLSFLNSGFIMEYFKWEGQIPDDTDLLGYDIGRANKKERLFLEFS